MYTLHRLQMGNYLSKLSTGIFPHQFRVNPTDSSEDKCEAPLGYWFSEVGYIRQMLHISH